MPINWWMDKAKGVYPYCGTLSHKKEWSTDTCYNMSELWKHCAKWNKPDTKTRFYWYEVPRVGKFIETKKENRGSQELRKVRNSYCWVDTGKWGVSVERIKRLRCGWWKSSGNAGWWWFTTLWRYLIPLNYTLTSSLNGKLSTYILQQKKRETKNIFVFFFSKSSNLYYPIHEVFVERIPYTRHCSWSWEYTSEQSKAPALMSLIFHMLDKTQRKQV